MNRRDDPAARMARWTRALIWPLVALFLVLVMAGQSRAPRLDAPEPLPPVPTESLTPKGDQHA